MFVVRPGFTFAFAALGFATVVDVAFFAMLHSADVGRP